MDVECEASKEAVHLSAPCCCCFEYECVTQKAEGKICHRTFFAVLVVVVAVVFTWISLFHYSSVHFRFAQKLLSPVSSSLIREKIVLSLSRQPDSGLVSA